MTSVYPSSSSQMSIKVCWGGSSIVLKDSWGLLVQSWETVACNLLRNIKRWVTSAGSLGFANSQLSAGAPYFTWKDRISAILLLQCYPATDVRGLFLEVTKCSRLNKQISLPNHCFQAATCVIDVNLFPFADSLVRNNLNFPSDFPCTFEKHASIPSAPWRRYCFKTKLPLQG